ncbi:MAG TPA: penicillin-binding protein 2 [Burkholderiales bacterium]|nr:penicillin-binding protein 2 [Burkholderiales bacterium]
MSAARVLLAQRLPVWRMRFVLVLLLAGFALLLARALYLQGMHRDFLQRKGESRYSRVVEVSAHRGMITDRHGEPLAISTPLESVWASPQGLALSNDQLVRLSKILEVAPAEIRKRTADSEREFVYLKRQLPPDTAHRAMALGIRGIFLEREYRRFYPAGEVTAHLIGFTGIDDNGQAGLELALEPALVGEAGSRRVIRNRLGHVIEDVESIRPPKPGRNLALSADSRIQYIAYRELNAAVAAHRAKGGGIVVLDARTGEVLALANSPSFNPNNRASLTFERARTRAVTDLFEPGSTLKPFTVAAALDAGIVKPDSAISIAPGMLKVGKRTIRDVHRSDVLTVGEIIQKSSNVGAAKLALALEPKQLWEVLERCGFGSAPQTGFPGEGAGKLRPYRDWKPIEQATLSYGHGISATLLQLARAYTVFANEGVLKSVSFLKRDAPGPESQAISARSAREVKAMLESVTHPGGTAPRARIAGYRVAGKTGTAHKLEDKRYVRDKYVSSFVGFAPASDPRLIIAVMIDEPSAGQHYGGAVAAPLFSNVMSATLRLLSVSPDAPESLAPVPPAMEIKEEV